MPKTGRPRLPETMLHNLIRMVDKIALRGQKHELSQNDALGLKHAEPIIVGLIPLILDEYDIRKTEVPAIAGHTPTIPNRPSTLQLDDDQEDPLEAESAE